jgi:peptidoglycan/LPS O-acetylase OafA/YrhL
LAFPLRLYFFLFAIGVVLTFAESLVLWMDAKHVPIVLLGGFITLGFSKGLFETSSSQWSILLEGIGSAAIVATVAFQRSAPILHYLDAPIARRLGRISYSFYLYHPLFFLTVLPFALKLGAADLPLAPVLSGAILSLITVPPTAALAYASYRFIEIPTIRACASLDARFAARSLRARSAHEISTASARVVMSPMSSDH